MLKKIFCTGFILLSMLSNVNAQTAAGTEIVNQAAAVYEFQGLSYQAQSNIVLVLVAPLHGVSIIPDGTIDAPGQIFYALPDSEVAIPYTLVNTGNITDSYRINAIIETESEVVPANQRIVADSNNNGIYDAGENIVTVVENVPPEGHRQLLVVLNIPGVAKTGQKAYVNISAISQKDSGVVDNDNVSRIDISEGPMLRLAMRSQRPLVKPGETISYIVEGVNVGTSSAEPIAVTVDDIEQRGALITAEIPKEKPEETFLVIESPQTDFGILVYSSDNGNSWSTTANEDATHVAVLFKEGLPSGQQFSFTFDVNVDSAHPLATITTQANAFFEDSLAQPFAVGSNQAPVVVVDDPRVLIGPHQNPFAEINGDDNADFQIIDEVNTGSRVSWRMTVFNGSNGEDILNLQVARSLPEGWSHLFLHGDGISPLVDSDSDGSVDIEVSPRQSRDIILTVTIPTDWQEDQVPALNLPVDVRSGANLAFTNRTFVRIGQINSLSDIWSLQKESAPVFEVPQGKRITYTLTFENSSNQTIENVNIGDVISQHLVDLDFDRFVIVQNLNSRGSVAARGSFDEGSRTLNWHIRSVPAGFKGQFTFSANTPENLPNDTPVFNQFSIISSLNPIAIVSNRVKNVVVEDILRVNKRVNKRKADIGDILIYTITVSNTSDVDLNSLQVVDMLPKSFRYGEKTTLIDGRKAKDPRISANDRVLTFELVNLEARKNVEIQFMTQIGPHARRGKNSVNLAQAQAITPQGATVSSLTARATTVVSGGVFSQHAWVFGRVYVDLNKNNIYEHDQEPVLPGVRLYLENGQYAITDWQGKYSLDVESGTHVLAIDKITLPANVKVRNVGRHNAHNGRTRFVDIKQPGPWRSDFMLELSKDSYFPYRISFKAKAKSFVIPFSCIMLLSCKTDHMSVTNKIILQKTFQESLAGNDLDVLEMYIQNVDKSTIEQQHLLAKIRPVVEFLRQRFSLAKSKLKIFWQDGKEVAMPEVGKKALQSLPKKQTGIVSPAAGEVFMDRGSIKVKIVTAMQKRASISINGVKVLDEQIGMRSYDNKALTATFEYVGIPLKSGKNIIVLTTTDPFGKSEEERVEVYKSKPPKKIVTRTLPAQIPADGRTEPQVIIELQDEDGKPATSGMFLTVQLLNGSGDIVSPDANPKQLGHQLYVKDGKAECILPSSVDPSECELVIQVAQLQHTVKISYVPYLRDWIIVGIGEGTVGVENSGVNGKDGLFVNERIAFFAQGRILGKFLLTAYYDSIGSSEEENTILKTIDPDKYYPVYGDESQQGYEIPSSGKLYVKLERNRNYILYGDYRTEIDGILTGYNRTLRGAKGEIRSKYLDVKMFGAYLRQVLVKDEIRGQGISGYYFLSNDGIIENSLQVVIETRDRFAPERILYSEPQKAYIDYDIDFRRGAILFSSPIPSNDIDGNPVYIVATYESKDAASKEFIGGVRATVKLWENRVRVGGTYIHEGQTKGNTRLVGTHAEIHPHKNIRIRGEIAQSRFFDLDKNVEKKGTGYALEVEAEFDNARVRAAYHKISENFHNPSISGVEEGTEKYSVDAEFAVSENMQVLLQARRAEAENRRIQDIGAGIQWQVDEYTAAIAGYLFAEQKQNGERQNIHVAFLGARTKLHRHLTIQIERHHAFPTGKNLSNQPAPQGVFTKVGSNAVNNFAAAQDALNIDALGDSVTSRTILGVEYAPTEWLTIWGQQEFADSDSLGLSRTIFGVNLQLLQHLELYTNYGLESSIYGKRNQALTGFRSGIGFNDWLSADVFLERISTLNGGSSDDFTAYGIHFKIAHPRHWGSFRFEVRHGEDDLKYLIAPTLTSKVNAFTLFWRTRHFQNGNANTFSHDTLWGIAYRPNCSDELNFIGKIQFDWERAIQEGNRIDDIVIGSSLDVHYRPFPSLDLMFRYANKYAQTSYNGISSSNYTDLFASRILYEFGNYFDFGVHGAVIHEYGSGQFAYTFGPEIGVKVVKDLWLSVGYNLGGLDSETSSNDEFLSGGFYLTMRFKFDEETAENLTSPW